MTGGGAQAGGAPPGERSAPAWPLSPRAARVFYNAADAWIDAVGDADLVAALAGALGAAERARLERALCWLEWSPRLALRSRRGLSWLPRAERRAWLERLEGGGPGWLRAAAARVHRAVDAAWARHAGRPAPPAGQALPGA